MNNKAQLKFVVLSLTLSLLILIFDLSLPLGVAGGVPYVALVLLGVWVPGRRHVFFLAFVGTALTVLGFFMSPAGGISGVVLTNRGLALFAIWITALLIVYLKTKEKALVKSEGKFRSFFQSSSIAMIMAVDDVGNIVSWNPGAEKIFGYTEDEIVGKPLTRIMPERFRKAHLAGMKKASATGAYKTIGTTVEVAGQHKDGHEFPLELSVNSWESEGHTIYSGLMQDITERKLTETALIKAKDEAEYANHAKTEFLANMSHELRTPLNAIIGFSEMIKKATFGPLKSQYQEYADHILSSGEHLLSIVSDILDIAKTEAGVFNIEEEEVDVAKITVACRTMVRGRAQQSGVTLEFDVQNDLPAIKADPIRLKQILINLLSNAIKFTPKGGHVTLTCKTADNCSMSLSVSDTGIGIAEKDIAVAVEKFSQVRDSYSRTHDGTGLGLPIAKSLMEQHGGTLDIESEVGKGTTVTVTFPPERTILAAYSA